MIAKALLFGSISLLSLGGCSKTTSSSGDKPTIAVTAPASAAGALDASVAMAPPDGGAAAAGERYLGAVGGLPVHAMLTVTGSSITGRWFYEKGGGVEGLAIEAHAHGNQKDHYVGTEQIADGGISGELSLERRGVELTGSWSKPGAEKKLLVILTPEVRSKVGDHVVRARRVMIKSAAPGEAPTAGFMPIVEGAAAARAMPSLTFKALLGEDETELIGGTITALDFDVVLDDARLLTLAITEDTMGAYPSSNVLTDTLDWTTGKKIGAEAFAADKKAALAKLLDKRVHDAWKAKRKELARAPAKPGECGPDVVQGFMDGAGPSFTVAMLDGVQATKSGLSFAFDFGFPHVVLACSPEVDLSISWADAATFVDPKGPLAGR